MPRPMPSPPPVTTATRPVSRMFDGSMAISELTSLGGADAMHRRGSADDPLVLEFGDLVVAEPQSGEHLVVVLSEERRGVRWKRCGPVEMRMGSVLCLAVAFTGWSTCS